MSPGRTGRERVVTDSSDSSTPEARSGPRSRSVVRRRSRWFGREGRSGTEERPRRRGIASRVAAEQVATDPDQDRTEESVRGSQGHGNIDNVFRCFI